MLVLMLNIGKDFKRNSVLRRKYLQLFARYNQAYGKKIGFLRSTQYLATCIHTCSAGALKY